MIEKYLGVFRRLHGLDYTILRIANPYGKHQKLTSEQGAVGVFLARIMEGKTITIWGDGSVRRDFIYVEDVADAFVKALTQHSPYRVFNIGSGVGLSLMELLSRMERVTGMTPRVEYSATPLALTLRPVLLAMHGWAAEHLLKQSPEQSRPQRKKKV